VLFVFVFIMGFSAVVVRPRPLLKSSCALLYSYACGVLC
jgi:hypothetical protein